MEGGGEGSECVVKGVLVWGECLLKVGGCVVKIVWCTCRGVMW